MEDCGSDMRVRIATDDSDVYTKHGASGPVREGQWLVFYKHELLANFDWMSRRNAVEFAKGYRDMTEVLSKLD